MKFKFCPDCGTKLIEKSIGDEGSVPYCEKCGRPLFDMFSTCVIVLVVNEDGEVALLRQNYISDKYHNLVSGYMKPGERAEEAASREVYEELGIVLYSLQIMKTYWFGKKDMLMIGFVGRTKDKKFTLSKEVDGALWAMPDEALKMVHPEGSISYDLIDKYLKGNKGLINL